CRNKLLPIIPLAQAMERRGTEASAISPGQEIVPKSHRFPTSSRATPPLDWTARTLESKEVSPMASVWARLPEELQAAGLQSRQGSQCLEDYPSCASHATRPRPT